MTSTTMPQFRGHWGSGIRHSISEVCRETAVFTIVFKIGGSLLDLPDLPLRLDSLLAQHPQARCLFIVGGGEAADLVRMWSTRFHLEDEPAHWLALQAMSLGERLLEELLPQAVVVNNRQEALAAWTRGQRPILAAGKFLRCEEAALRAGGDPEAGSPPPGADASGSPGILPHDWSVTSDSIAAWVTLRWKADELVLVKSCAAPADGRLADDDPCRFVDGHFSTLAGLLPRLSWVNLREEQAVIQPWNPMPVPVTSRPGSVDGRR